MTHRVRVAALSRATELSTLVGAARHGDKQANAALWAHCSALAQRIARRWAANSADADDVSQEALLRVFQSLDRVRDPSALPGWVQVVVVRMVARITRQSVRLRVAHCDPELVAAREPSLDAQVELRRVLASVRRLPAEERTCFWLRRAEGLAIREIARETSLSPSTIHRRLRVAERRIAKAVPERARGATAFTSRAAR